MKAFLFAVLKKLGYLFAICIIAGALLVSMGQLLTPWLDRHREEWATWASTLLGMPVQIGHIRVSWYRYQPAIRLDQVLILNEQKKHPILQIAKVRLFFSIPQSLWARKPIPSSIMIAGSEVHVHRNAAGEMAIQGFPTLSGQSPDVGEAKSTAILAWLSQQPRLILRDIDVKYTGFNDQKRWVTLQQFSIENTRSKHTVFGEAMLHQEVAMQVTVAMEWTGDVTDLKTVYAKGYLSLSGVSLVQWLKKIVWQGWQIKGGLASAKIWATWDQGAWRHIQSKLRLDGVKLYAEADRSMYLINRLSGRVGWKRVGANQVIAGEDILIDLPMHVWPLTRFYVTRVPDATGSFRFQTVNIGYLDLHDIQTFLFASPSILSPTIRHSLHQLQLRGELRNMAMTMSEKDSVFPLSFMADFNHLGFAGWNQVPAMDQLSGRLKWDGTQADLLLRSKQMQLRYDALFDQPLFFKQLAGELQLQKQADQAWVVQVKSLRALNQDGMATVKGMLSVPAEGSPAIDLSANFSLQKVQHVASYLPLRLFEPDLAKWLKQAFLSGHLSSGVATLRGRLKDFPFHQDHDVFFVSGMLDHLDFRFDSAWPLLRQVKGKLVFSGRQMMAEANQAEMLGVSIPTIKGTLSDIGGAGPQILEVTAGEIHADFSDGWRVVQASPLEKTFGQVAMQVHGPMTLKLGLTVPLRHPDRTQAQGNIAFQKTRLDFVPWHLSLADLQGSLRFTEKTVRADAIQGLLWGRPVTLQLATIQPAKKESAVQIKLDSYLEIKDIEAWLKYPLSDLVQGGAHMNMEVQAAMGAPIAARIQSDLVGVAVQLPGQYAKSAPTSRSFQAEVTVQQPLRVRLTYGDLLGAALILERQKNVFHLTSGHLHLGSGSVSWPTAAGWFITGDLKQLDWDKIKTYMHSSGHSSFSTLLRRIDIRTEVLHLLGQRLVQVRLQVTPIEGGWEIYIANQQVEGTVQIPATIAPQQQIAAQFQRLALSTTSNAQPTPLIEVKSLPRLSLTARRVSYNGLSFGEVSFKTSPIENGLNIDSLTMTSPQMSLRANGRWTQTNGHDLTQLTGRVTSKQVSQLLERFGLDVHNFVAHDGQLNFNLNWRGAPYAPTLAALNGQASLNLDRGQILEVSQASGAKMGIGRMLSLFSLQTIPRRLSLDFSDIFQRGYSFDSIRGDFSLQAGNVYTKNSRIEGPVARVDIYGRIGLTAKDYDLALSITPYVTSSLPIAATLLTGPVGGVATWAVTKVINSQVSSLVTYSYVVTGPWENPRWQSVKTVKKKD